MVRGWALLWHPWRPNRMFGATNLRFVGTLALRQLLSFLQLSHVSNNAVKLVSVKTQLEFYCPSLPQRLNLLGVRR